MEVRSQTAFDAWMHDLKFSIFYTLFHFRFDSRNSSILEFARNCYF